MRQEVMVFGCLKHKCGHIIMTQDHMSERDNAYAQTRDCKRCFIQKSRQENTTLAHQYRLPDLIGSPPQVSWANQLRIDAIKKAKESKKIELIEFIQTIETAGGIISQHKKGKI